MLNRVILHAERLLGKLGVCLSLLIVVFFIPLITLYLLHTNGFAYKRFVDILETFDCVQHIDKPTHNSGHLLDYIITRKDSSGVSNLYVSDFISDHRALHVSLTCSRAHPERKQIEVRSLKRIQGDVLEADLICVNIDRECTDVNLVVRQYDASLSSLLDKHAPSKRIYVVERPMNDWMTDDILVLKAPRRKYESLWRKTRLTVHFDMYSECCMDVQTAIRNSKSEILQRKISDCNGDQKKLFKIVDTLLGRNKHTTLPKYDSPLTCIIFLFLQCVSTVIIVHIIISPLNSYLYIHWILDFK